MANKTMKTLTIDKNTYEIVDAAGRSAITYLNTKMGDVTQLSTTDKTSVVNAINELANRPSGGGGIAKVSVNSISPDADGNIELGKEDVGIYTDESAPTNPQEGDLWFTTSNDSSGSGVLIVRVDQNREGYVTHTSIEIKEAIDNGQMAYLEYEGAILTYSGIGDDGTADFAAQAPYNSKLYTIEASITDTGKLTVVTNVFTFVPSYASTDYGKLLSPSSDGLVWVNAPSALPSGGTEGQILTKAADGSVVWSDPPEGGGGGTLSVPSAQGVVF